MESPFLLSSLVEVYVLWGVDSVECGTVEWNSGTVEWWNSGMVGWSIDDPLLLCRCHSNKHACAFWRDCNFSVRGRYSYDRLLVPSAW